MASQSLLEITVESLDTALAAERGGADRIELCAELALGGITPSVPTMRKLHEELEIPIFPIIRPRGGDYVYTDQEFDAMKRDISVARDLGVDGVVFGILKVDHSIDVERTTELAEWARPLDGYLPSRLRSHTRPFGGAGGCHRRGRYAHSYGWRCGNGSARSRNTTEAGTSRGKAHRDYAWRRTGRGQHPGDCSKVAGVRISLWIRKCAALREQQSAAI